MYTLLTIGSVLVLLITLTFALGLLGLFTPYTAFWIICGITGVCWILILYHIGKR